MLKLSKSRPSWTIQARPGPHIGPFHLENRRLTAAEMCRLQTFPDIRFDSSHSEIQRMLGNAVPSLLTEILGLEIRRQLLLAPRRSKKLKLLLPRCTLIPPSEVTRPVPERYWPLAGDHPDHPGEGQGRAAKARAQASASPQSPLF